MNIFTYTHRGAAKAMAAIMMMTLFMSAFPAAFFVAFAATPEDLYVNAGPVDVTSAAPLTSPEIDASTYENLRVKFNYNAEALDGGNPNNADDFEYGWQVGATKTKLGDVKGKDEGGNNNNAATDETGVVDLSIPVGGQVSNLQIYMKVIGGSGTGDKVTITSFSVTGEKKSAPVIAPEYFCKAEGNNKYHKQTLTPVEAQELNDGKNAGLIGPGINENNIIPPFGDFAGYNWTPEDQEIWNDGCETGGGIVKSAEFITVTGDNFDLGSGKGWLFNRDAAYSTPFAFNDAEASLNDGSVQIAPIGNSNGNDKFIAENFVKIPVADFLSLSYDFFIEAVDAADANEFYLNIYTNIDDSANYYDCRFDYVPTTGALGAWTSVTFEADDIPTDVKKRGDRISSCPATLAEMPAGSYISFFTLNVGDTSLNDAGVAGNFDNVILDTIPKITTWDFEPKKVAERNVTIVATKIVCEDESLLPNDGYTMIDANTAAAFLASSPERTAGCALAPDWQFQWALGGQSTQSSPDNAGELGSPWVTTPATDNNGQVTVVVPASTLSKNTQLSVREVVKDSHIPFTGTGGSNVSAEMYCHTDAANFDNLDWIKGVSLDNTYHCVAWNVPKTADVTMCKLDDEQQPLKGWQLSLLGSKVGEVSVLPNGQDYLIEDAPAGDYVLKAGGTYVYRPTNLPADAAFSERLPGDPGYATAPYQPWLASTYFAPQNYLGVQVNGTLPWGDVFNPAHIYYANWNPTDPLNDGVFKITDTAYGDNSGSILVEAFAGYTGVTNETGCVTFENVPYGTYTAEELLQEGWANVEGLGPVVVDAPKVTHNVVNKDVREVPPATIIAHKIVCTDESELPNGVVGSPITADTAADWVEANKSCSLVPDWQFQWAESNVSNPDNSLPATPLFGAAGAGWNTFGPTDANGMTTVNVPAAVLENNAALWVREVLKDGYIPFTYGPGNMTNEDNYTAEIYCHTDVKNFDNFDRIDGPKSGGTYHCVAWNHEAPEPLVCDPKVNLLANPSFEATPVVNAAGWDIFNLTSHAALGWAVEFVSAFTGRPDVASLELQKNVNGWTASNGAQYAELDSDWQGPAGTSGEEASVMINQVIPTIPGAKYTLSWDFSPRPGTTQTENDLAIFVDDMNNPVASNSAAGGAAVSWTGDSYTFTASGNTTKIAFADDGTPNSVGTFLDNTSLVCGQPAPQCSLEILSSTKTIVVDSNDFAVETYDGNDRWTASIPGAEWIWDTDKVIDPTVDTTRTFEETFTVNGPMNASLEIAADNSYRVFINGNLFLDRSDIANNYQTHTKKLVDITPALISGENKIRFEVTNHEVSGSNHLNNPAGVLFKIALEGTDNCAITTDKEPEVKTYPVTGIKWNDLNGNGVKDGEEQNLPNWTIYAYNEETDEERMTTTNGDGEYTFNLPAGIWEISEGNQPNWYQTAPLSEVCTFNLDEPLFEAFAFISDVIGDGEIGGIVIPLPVQEGNCDFGNQFRDGDNGGPTVDVRGSTGGGSSSPRCEIDFTREGNDITLDWSSSRANEMVLTANGDEIFSSDDEDEVDNGEFEFSITEDTEFEMTVSRGSRERTCTVDVDVATPDTLVAGEQVSVIPLGAADAGAGGAVPFQHIPALIALIATAIASRKLHG